MVKQLYEAATQNDRIVGLVDYGSGGQRRIDEGSSTLPVHQRLRGSRLLHRGFNTL